MAVIITMKKDVDSYQQYFFEQVSDCQTTAFNGILTVVLQSEAGSSKNFTSKQVFFHQHT